MDLAQFLEQSYLPDRIGISAGYVEELRRTVRQFGNPDLKALSKPLLAAFLQTYAEQPVTANNKRTMIMAIWREAHEAGLAPPPAAPKRLAQPEDVPTAWTVEEVGELLWTASHWPGSYSGVPAGLWWASLFCATYWTACRVGALLKATWRDYGPAGLTIYGRSQKNKRGQLFRLPTHCRVKLDALPRIADRIWPWPHCRHHVFDTARKIVERAGLDAPKVGRQLFHRLRRTNISYCAAVDIAIAQRQAGHQSPETTIRHYVAPTILNQLSAAEILPTPDY